MSRDWRGLPAAWKICLLCLTGYLALPWPAPKLILASAALAAAASAPQLSLGPFRRFALWSCFALALLVPPYWLYFGGAQRAAHWQIAWWGVIVCGGWLWVAAVDSLTRPPEPAPAVPWWKAAAVAAALLAINWAGLYQVLPSRGDETTHIFRLWGLLSFGKSLARDGLAPLAAALAALAIWLRRFPRLRYAAAGALGGAAGLWICASIRACWYVDLLYPPLPRYPGLQLAWQATALLYAPFKSWIALEALYRVVPFLAVLALALYIVRVPLAGSSTPTQLGAALVIATAPAVRYYSTLLYLDLPLVAAMAVACFEIERLAAASRLGKMPAGAGWWALILAGFLKETAFLFVLIAFLFCARGGPRRWAHMAWALGGPLAIFLMTAGEQRLYSFRPANWLLPSNYKILAGALWEQYGLLLALAAAGALLLALEKRWRLLAFGLLSALAYTAFYMADGNLIFYQGAWRPKYLGHARFMLAWLPALAVCSVHALRLLRRPVSWLAAALILAGNLWLYPASTVAAPSAHWGDYVYDTSDHFYPYNTAFERGRAEFPSAQRVIVVGPDYFYPYAFYQTRWGWPAAIEARALTPGYTAEQYRHSVDQAAAQRPELIWVHVMKHLPPAVYESVPPGYTPAGEYRSRFERILVFRRQ